MSDIASDLQRRSDEYLAMALEGINALGTLLEPAEFKTTDQLIKAVSSLTIGKVLSALADVEAFRVVSEQVTPARARREALIKRYSEARDAIARGDWAKFDRIHAELSGGAHAGDETGRGGDATAENGPRPSNDAPAETP